MKNVKDFGAVGDGKTKDTAAVQRAIDSGGMICFPPGIYLCGTLYLKSHGGLYLESGAVLLASPDREDYNADDFCVQNSVFRGDQASGAHFIVALEQENITIEGPGRIDGNREAFYPVPKDWWDRCRDTIEWRPAQMVYICESSNIRIRDIELYNAPYWTCFLHGCENAQVSGLHIYNHPHTRNGDGLDIDCCRNVTVSDCLIESGDDCITLRGHDAKLKNKKPCEYITITNCILRTICNAFRIGVGSGIIRNAVISNCIIRDSRMGIMLCSRYSAKSTGTLLENIQFENIRIEAELPIALLTNSWQKGPSAQPIRDISFHHIRGEGCSSIRLIGGNSEDDIKNISFSDVVLDWKDGGNPSSDTETFSESASAPCPDASVYLECAKHVSFDRFQIRWKTENPNWKYGLRAKQCSGIELSGSDFGKEVFVPVSSEEKLP